MKKSILIPIVAIIACGCLQVKTESEIKPIHITMDVNLKVDRALDKAFADENQAKPKGDFVAVKEMLDRQAAGITSLGLLEPRPGATDDDKILVAENNSKRMRRFKEVAESSGVALESVQRRKAKKMREMIPAGAGVWWQDDDGSWHQK